MQRKEIADLCAAGKWDSARIKARLAAACLSRQPARDATLLSGARALCSAG